MLSTNTLFAVCCVIGFLLAVVMPALAAWTEPAICATLAALLVVVVPLIFRGHQWSIVVSATAFVAAGSAVAYLAFAPVSEAGAWAPGKTDLILAGCAFALWMCGLITGGVCYSLTAYPLVMHLALPVFAFLLFKISLSFA
ncbi:MAG: hypothetical protein AAGJ79_14355 [Verrucomicrobiota bacterium]